MKISVTTIFLWAVQSGALTLTTGGKTALPSRFSIQQPDPEHLILDSQMEGHKVRMETRRFDRNKFLLVSHGFNWIQERPLNR